MIKKSLLNLTGIRITNPERNYEHFTAIVMFCYLSYFVDSTLSLEFVPPLDFQISNLESHIFNILSSTIFKIFKEWSLHIEISKMVNVYQEAINL